MRGMYLNEAQAQAKSMEAAAERIHSGTIARLRTDPLAELSLWDDLAVVVIDESSNDSGCSVAGSYQPNPATLVVTNSLSSGRRGFTALHELGHHLQQTDIALGNAVFGYSDPYILGGSGRTVRLLLRLSLCTFRPVRRPPGGVPGAV